MPYDSTGFTPQTTLEIKAELEADLTGPDGIDPGLLLTADQPFAQILGIFSDKLASHQQLLQTAFGVPDPAKAEGTFLDSAAALTGTQRIEQSFSRVAVSVNLNMGVTLPPGVLANLLGNANVKFQNVAPIVATTAGNYIGVFEALTPGPVPALAGSLTVITAPVTGWNSITNPTDAVLGNNRESDAELRLRRIGDLFSAGAATLEAMKSDVLVVPGVQQVFVEENVTEAADVYGVSPHTYRVTIYDGLSGNASNTSVAQAIFNSKPTGIIHDPLYGTVYYATDVNGYSHLVRFARATQDMISVMASLSVDSTFPVDGITQVKNLMLAYIAQQKIGQAVNLARFKAIPFQVTGVLDVTAFSMGGGSGPDAYGNIIIPRRDIAICDSAHITLNAVLAP